MYCAAAQNTTAQLACAQCASGIFSMTLGTDTPGYMQHEYVKPVIIYNHPAFACFSQLFPLFIVVLVMATVSVIHCCTSNGNCFRYSLLY
jgi:hypothetical protein